MKQIFERMFNWVDAIPIANQMPYHTQWFKYFLEQSILPSTYRGYKSSFKQYIIFCVKYGLQPLPITDIQMAYFHIDRGLSKRSGTVKSDFYALSYFSKLAGMPINTTEYVLSRELRKDMQKVLRCNLPDPRKPITIDILNKMYNLFDLNDYNSLVAWTAIVTAYTGFLRTSEFVAKKKNIKCNGFDEASIKALFIQNLKPVFNKNNTVEYFKLLLRASKTDKSRLNIWVILGKGAKPVCAVTFLQKMLEKRIQLAKKDVRMQIKPDSPLFMLDTHKILSQSDLSIIMKKASELLGLPDCSKTYCLRQGAATDAKRKGCNSHDIQIMGRWQSEAYKVYVRIPEHNIANLQNKMINAPIINPNIEFVYDNIPAHELVGANMAPMIN